MTIAAIATPKGLGGIAVVRISGKDALGVLKKIFSKKGAYEPRKMYLGKVKNGENVIDEALAVYMPAPHSYTGEDVCEVQCHGGSIVAENVLKAAINAGARLAEAGEFTRRAFMNGKLDLSQAEAVMQLIGARSAMEAKMGMRQLSGGVSVKVKNAVDMLKTALSKIEACDDFPEEIDEIATGEEIARDLDDIIAFLTGMVDEKSARLIRNGASVVLTGKPNVGKSSIMNALSNTDTAIVTDIAGTTRDALTINMEINGIHVELTDTAGRRETDDAIEKIGVARAENYAREADLRLIVLDASKEISSEDEKILDECDENSVIVMNKCDMDKKIDIHLINSRYDHDVVCVSALTGEGIDLLKEKIASRADAGEPDLVNVRHIEAVKRSIESLKGAYDTINGGFPLDIAAVDIYSALGALCEITGENAAEEVIGEVFANFCVGK